MGVLYAFILHVTDIQLFEMYIKTPKYSEKSILGVKSIANGNGEAVYI